MTEVLCQLPNGSTLYREDNGVGGHRYISDEVGGGVCVWDTCLVASATLLAALTEDARWRYEQLRRYTIAEAAVVAAPPNDGGGCSGCSQ
jgi:hypothetical protein